MIVSTRICDMPEAPIGATQRQQSQLDREHAAEAQLEPFGVDGRLYEIDLCAAHRRAFRELSEHWAGQGRRVAGGAVKPGSGPNRGPRRRTQQDRERSALVRAWARENGWPGLGDRGRLIHEIGQAYDQAHAQ